MAMPGQSRPPESKTAVGGFVVLVIGAIGVLLSFTALSWASANVDKAKFGDIHDSLSATGASGLGATYFSWMAWALLAAAAVFAILANLPSGAQNYCRALGVIISLLGIGLTYAAVHNLKISVSDLGAGFWVALIGFLLIGVSALVPSRPVVTYQPNYGVPTDQQKFAQPHRPSPGVSPGMPLGSAPPPQNVYSQPASAPYPQQVPGVAAAAAPGWLPDPARRFELRYWDGGRWTENVSTGGNQYTDPI